MTVGGLLEVLPLLSWRTRRLVRSWLLMHELLHLGELHNRHCSSISPAKATRPHLPPLPPATTALPSVNTRSRIQDWIQSLLRQCVVQSTLQLYPVTTAANKASSIQSITSAANVPPRTKTVRIHFVYNAIVEAKVAGIGLDLVMQLEHVFESWHHQQAGHEAQTRHMSCWLSSIFHPT